MHFQVVDDKHISRTKGKDLFLNNKKSIAAEAEPDFKHIVNMQPSNGFIFQR